MSLSDTDVRHLKDRFGSMNKSQLEDRALGLTRDLEKSHDHRDALRRELARTQELRLVNVRELQAHLGGPILEDLILALASRVEAASPVRGAPVTDTMRVSTPSSERMGDPATEAHREILDAAKNDLKAVIRQLRKGIGEGQAPAQSSVGGPRCHNRDCKRRGRRHSYGTTECPECGRPVS